MVRILDLILSFLDLRISFNLFELIMICVIVTLAIAMHGG